MAFERILSCNYHCNDSLIFDQEYHSRNGILGSNAFNSISISPLHDDFGLHVGEIQFNTVNIARVTNPPLISVCEQIFIKLDNCSTIMALNQHNSLNGGLYEDNSKAIIPIVSCVGGDLVGKTGYIVIDSHGEFRNVYIGLK